MTDLEVIHATGEIVTVGRMTPAQAADWSKWVRDLMTSVLVKDVDYGVIPGTGTKPTMYKSGGEMLLRAAGLGFSMERLPDDDYARYNGGVTYRCTVYRPDGSIVATCDGYCGSEEPGKKNALRNSIVKIAQKRALVGVALNATASSGLFTADLDDEPPPTDATADDLLMSNDDRGYLKYAIEQLSDQATEWLIATAKADIVRVNGRRQIGIPNLDGPKFRRSHRDRLAWHILVAQRIKPAAPVDEPTPPEVHDDAPDAVGHDDGTERYDPNDAA